MGSLKVITNEPLTILASVNGTAVGSPPPTAAETLIISAGITELSGTSN
jgi:hypothetical protein